MIRLSTMVASFVFALVSSSVIADDGTEVGMPMGAGVTNGRGLYLRPICLKPGEKQGCAEMCFRRLIPTSEKKVENVRGVQFQLSGVDVDYWNENDQKKYNQLVEGFSEQKARSHRVRSATDPECFGPKLSGAAWAQVFACKEIDRDWRDLMEVSLKQDENWLLWSNAAVLKRKAFRKFAEYIGGDGWDFQSDLKRCGIIPGR